MTIRASQVMGAMVVDREGARLGRVSDLLIEDSTSASISYVLVELEHSSRGDRTVAVPWSVLASSGERQIMLDVSRDTLSHLRDIGRP